MTYMPDGKTANGEIVQISVGERTTEGDGFETVHPSLTKHEAAQQPKTITCTRVLLKTHFSTIRCELGLPAGHEPPCEGKGIRR